MKQMDVPTVSDMQRVADAIVAEAKKAIPTHAAVIALHGDLGAGKTTLVQILARTLGIKETLTSPTFVIMKGYEGAAPFSHLIHIDAYRIEDIDEMRVLSFADLLEQKGTMMCIEWAERIAALLPEDTLHVRLEVEGEIRKITMYRHGEENTN